MFYIYKNIFNYFLKLSNYIDYREQHEVDLPEVGRYATGILFLDIAHHEESEGLFAALARECELKVS